MFGMRRLENMTRVFLGKNEGTPDWPRRAGRPAGASSYGHMGCVAFYTPCCIWRADGLGGKPASFLSRDRDHSQLFIVCRGMFLGSDCAGRETRPTDFSKKRGVARLATVSTSVSRRSIRAIAGLLWRFIPRAGSGWKLAWGRALEPRPNQPPIIQLAGNLRNSDFRNVFASL